MCSPNPVSQSGYDCALPGAEDLQIAQLAMVVSSGQEAAKALSKTKSELFRRLISELGIGRSLLRSKIAFLMGWWFWPKLA